MGTTTKIAVAAALFFWLGALLEVLIAFGVVGGANPAPDAKKYRALDYSYLQTVWAHRREVFPYAMAGSFLTGVGYLLLLTVGLDARRALEGFNVSSSSLNTLGACLALAAGLPILEFLQQAGVYEVADYLSKFPGMNANTLAALEISFEMVRAMFIWVFGVELLLLAVVMFVLSNLSLKHEGKLWSRGHAILGIVTGVLGVIGFITEVSVATGAVPGAVAIGFGVIVLLFGLFLFPIWLILLASQLDNKIHAPVPLRDGREEDEIALEDTSA